MKKIFLALAFFAATAVHAEDKNEDGAFKHFTVGVTAGTTGIGFEVGTTISPYIGLRAGYDFMPSVKVNTTLEYDRPEVLNNVPVELLNERYVNIPAYGAKIDAKGTLHLNQGNVLFDIFLGKKSSFHFTVGAYFGDEVIAKLRAADKTIAAVELYNSDIKNGLVKPEKDPKYKDGIFVDLEGYRMGSSSIDKGRSEINVKANAFRPYLGFGFGRTVPRHTIGCRFDMGVEFIGKYKIYDKYRNYEITEDEPGLSSDFKDVVKILGSVPVYPSLKLSIVGKIL